jgi:protocatechuate 3,4-dioxygenase beta subunit
VLLILAMPTFLAAAPQRQAADVAPNTSRIVRGQVRSDDDGATLLRRVRVSVIDDPGIPVYTDQQGRFEIAVSGSSSFTLRVSKPGYAFQQVPSSRIPPETDMLIRLAPGAAIVGRVADESGLPAVDVGVRVQRVGENSSDISVSASTRTDDLGEFRVGSLPAGRYQVAVANTGAIVTISGDASAGFTMRAALPPTARTGPGAPPPLGRVPACNTDASAECAELLARATAAAAEPSGPLVELRAGDEVDVILVHDASAPAVRSATAYAAGFTAGSQDGLDAATAIQRSRDTGVVVGRVTGPNGGPMPGALLRLNPVTPGVPPRVVASDSDGEYEFRNVAAGIYNLMAARVGFLPGEYGQQGAGRPGATLTVRDGQRLDGIDVALPRGGVITGIVTDEGGEPLEGLAMQVWRARSRDGPPAAEMVANVAVRHTDDRGRYRIHGLQPGAYYVVAADDVVPTTGSGRVTALRGAPRSFYPGAATLMQAAVVRVDAGVAVSGTDISFTTAPAFRVHGQAFDTDGDPVTWPVAMTVSGRSGGPITPPLSAPLRFDGSFEFAHVPPGQYVLQAFQMSGRQFGRSVVDVVDGDVGPVRLNVTPTASVRGRIVAAGRQLDRSTNQIRIDVLPADSDYHAPDALPRAPVFRLDADGAFEVSGLVGPVRFVATSAPAGWWLESVNIDGVNAADDPVLFETPDDSRDGIEIVFSTDGAEVSGRATNGRNDPVATYEAVVFPADRNRWYAGSRYVKTARPNQDARFSIAALAPGDYWIATVDALPDAAVQDVDMLVKLSTVARRVTIGAGEKLSIDVPIARVPR